MLTANSAGPVNEHFFDPNPLREFPPLAQRPVEDDADLLRMIVEDSANSHALWQPTKYWANYAGRIVEAIGETGLAALRQQNEILSGFQTGDILGPTLPIARWKKAVWRAIEEAPVISSVIAGYRQAIEANLSIKQRYHNGLAMVVLDRIAESYPNFLIPEGHICGHPKDLILWRGHYVSASWVDYLFRVSDFYQEVPPSEIESFLEIGPGLGWTTVSHLALNPNFKLGVNVDISPVLYVSTQFLKSVGDLEVIDYRATRNMDKIVLEPGANKPRIYQIAPWQVPKLEGRLDLFANAFSFYEMETHICENYITAVKPLINKAVLLHASITGKALDHGPREAISLDFLVDLFSDEFPNRKNLEFGWNEIYGRFSTAVALLTR